MRIVLGVLALSAAACGDDGNMFPVGGGNDGSVLFPDSTIGGGSDSGTGDAAPSDGSVTPDDAALIMGRVCVLVDPRVLNDCAATGASGLTVRLGTASAVTTADGSFTIEAPSATSGLVWRITGANIVSSFEPLADYFIPAMPRAMYDAMLSANNITEYPGEGAMLIFASSDGQGVAGVTATTTPLAFYDPLYEGTTANTWDGVATGTNGAIWVPGIDVGTASIAVDGPAGDVTLQGPIFDGGITFANALLP